MQVEYNNNRQTLSESGRIKVSKKAWLLRITTLSTFVIFSSIIVLHAFQLQDVLILFALVMPAHSLIILLSSWVYYRNPAMKPGAYDKMPLVSIIIPIYNQVGMITKVIDSIYKSTYPNIEVLAVNDGSKDLTDDILNQLPHEKYHNLRIVHKVNAGKRRAVSTGFDMSKGEIIVLIDSDTIIGNTAISEIVKTFNTNPNTGAVVGHVKVLNAMKNVLTKCQSCWYDHAFSCVKSCESTYGSVMVCSGCLAAYRRKAIEKFMPYWSASHYHYSDDRELTWYANAPKSGKEHVVNSIKNKFLKYASSFDDADDRVLTANAMDKKWDATYISTAIAYTEVPETFKSYTQQQERWKRGTARTNAYAFWFFWKRHPIMAFLYYFEVIGMLFSPLLTVGILLYEGLVVHEVWFPIYFFGLMLWRGFAFGLDFKARDPSTKTWMYQPLMIIIQIFYLGFLIFPALLSLKKGQWGTR